MNKFFAVVMLLAAVVALCAAVPYPAPYPAAAPAPAAPKESLKGQEAVYVGYAGYPYFYPGHAVAYIG